MEPVKMNSKINQPVNEGLVTGRNGAFGLKQVELWEDDLGRIWIDCYGIRGTILNAGFYIDRESFDKLVDRYVEEREYYRQHPEEAKM